MVCGISINGMIAKNSEDNLSWTGSEDKKWFAAVSREAGVIIMGNKAFKQINRPLTGRLIKVMVLPGEEGENVENQVEYTSKKPVEVIEELKNRGYEKVIIGGGAMINSLYLKANLIDEIWLSVIPVVFGGGVNLVANDLQAEKQLELIGTEKIGENGIAVKYRVK